METSVKPHSKTAGHLPETPHDNLPAAADDFDEHEDHDEFDGESAPAAAETDFSPISLRLGDDCRGQRLDKALSALLPQFSRARLQQWIDDGL
ncbi:MAG: hypothetical protein RL404_1, partial [Pseudomonadota bacterium]